MSGCLRSGWLAIALGLFCLLALPRPAAASFGDCNDPAYLATFDPRLAHATDFLCAPSDQATVSSDAGVSHIRIAQHLVSDWAAAPGAVASLKNGIFQAAAAMGQLGSFRITDVTVLLLDDFSPGGGNETFGQIAALTNFGPGDECKITVYLLGPGATADYGASVIEHELFHCVQRSSVSAGAITGAASWWLEGSADWFSTLASPAPAYMADRVNEFDSHSATTPLNAMSYDAYVFFAWLGGSHGPSSVVPFLRQMSGGGQQAAMTRALPAADWLQFAEAYMDGQIRDGQGASIGSSPQEGAALDWTETRSQRVSLEPFVIARRRLAFHCGRWQLAVRPSQFYAVQADGGGWGDLPGDLDNQGDTGGRFRYVAMATGTSATAQSIAATLAQRCAECGGSRQIDRCLVGAWSLTVDGALAFAREHFPHGNVAITSHEGETILMRSDGTFETGNGHTETEGAGPGGLQGNAYLNSHATGRWSASGGQVTYCIDSARAAGQVNLSFPGGSASAPLAPAIPPQASHSYVCNGSSFTQTTQVGRLGAVRSTYNKIGDAP